MRNRAAPFCFFKASNVKLKRDGLLLATMPSSGSDWVADCICKANPQLVYAREFFNPTVNWRRAERLERDLGDITFAAAPQLCRNVSRQAVQSLIADTWRQAAFTFTKECYLAFQLEHFAETFSVVVLLRRFADTFPPNRQRVMRWYENFHGALRVAGLLNSYCQSRSETPMNRAAIGYYWFAKQLHETASGLGAKVLWFHDLASMSPESLAAKLAGLPFDVAKFVDVVVKTRDVAPRPSGEYQEQWQAAAALYCDLEGRYGRI